MGLIYNVYLTSNHRIYGCRECKTHLATQEDVVSRVSNSLSSTLPNILLSELNSDAELPWPAREGISLRERRQH